MAFPLYRILAERRRASGDLPGALAILHKGLRGAPKDLDLVAVCESSLSMVRAIGTAKGGSKAKRSAMELLDEVEARIAENPGTAYLPHLQLARSEALLGRESRVVPFLRNAVERGLPGAGSLSGDPDFKDLSGNPEFRALTSPQ
jgi:hypothetical protein